MHQQETFGVIGDPATAMRDPIFYRWHAFIDDVFQEHKNTLPRYQVNQVSKASCKKIWQLYTNIVVTFYFAVYCICNTLFFSSPLFSY